MSISSGYHSYHTVIEIIELQSPSVAAAGAESFESHRCRELGIIVLFKKIGRKVEKLTEITSNLQN